MSKTANNIGQICTKEEFERFKSFHELFRELMKERDLPSEKFDRLFEDINDFETGIAPIGKKVGIDLGKHVDAVVEIWEQLGSLPDPYDTKGISFPSDEYGDAATDYFYEQEHRLQACKDAIADLDKVMITLYASQPKRAEAIEYMTAVLEDILERRKEGLAGRQWYKWIINWIVAKTSHFILTVFVTIFAAVIAAIVVDIFADFGWLQSIKEFIYNGLQPK